MSIMSLKALIGSTTVPVDTLPLITQGSAPAQGSFGPAKEREGTDGKWLILSRKRIKG